MILPRSPLATLALSLSLFFAYSVAASFAADNAAQTTHSPFATYAGQQIVPGSFLIEVGGGSLSKRDGAAHLSRILSRLAAPSSSVGNTSSFPTFTATRQLTARPSLFHGAVIKVDDDHLLQTLAQGGQTAVKSILEGLHSVDGIEHAWPLRILRGTAPLRGSTNTRAGMAASSMAGWELAPLSKRGSTTFPPPSAYANDTFNPHVMTGVANLHNQGVLGSRDIKVAVIDSGVDYLNPILGGCFGPGCLISFGGDYSVEPPGSTPYPCHEHGTHVTGTIAALANSYGFSGVAPGVTMGHFRTADCDDSSRDDHVIAALLAAANEHANVITASIGRASGWLDTDPDQLVMERLVTQENIVVTVSVGNGRAVGPFLSLAPASTMGVISVGAVNAEQVPAFPAQVTSFGTVLYLASKPLNTSSLPASDKGYRVYFTNTSSTVTNDACEALPAETPDFKIVLMYNSPDALNLTSDLYTVSTGLAEAVSMRYEDGTKLLNWYISQDRNLSIDFPKDGAPVLVPDDISGGVLWDGTSWGPTSELFGQPSLVGPGGNILSTFPLNMSGIGVLSGTSMSTPFVAGAAALVLSQRKADNLTAADVRALLTTTASRLPPNRSATTLETVLLQGGGLIQVDKAISTGTIVSPFELMLNDTAFPARTQTVTLRNTNPFPLQYTFSSSPTEAYATYDKDPTSYPFISMTPQSIFPQAGEITFSAEQITVDAGQTASLTVTIAQPPFSPTDLTRFPLYSGYIDISGTNVDHSHTEELHIPYFGLAAAMRDMPVLDSTAEVYGKVAYPFITSYGFAIFDAPGTLSASQEFTVLLRLASGTRFFSVDVILSSDALPTTIPTRRRLPRSRRATRDGWASLEARDPAPDTVVRRPASPLLFSDTPVVGSIARLPYPSHRDYFTDPAPNDFSERQFPFVPNRAPFQMQQGVEYCVLVRALKITADPTLASSYESWVSFPFTLSA